MFRSTIRFTLATTLLTFACVALAADKYPAPAPATIPKVASPAIVIHETGFPQYQINADGTYTYYVKGGYNYDDTWAFKGITATVFDAGQNKVIKGVTIASEGKGADKGAIKIVFPNLPAPGKDDTPSVILRITVSKEGFKDYDHEGFGSPVAVDAPPKWINDDALIVE